MCKNCEIPLVSARTSIFKATGYAKVGPGIAVKQDLQTLKKSTTFIKLLIAILRNETRQ
jgi:hypothetical protein